VAGTCGFRLDDAELGLDDLSAPSASASSAALASEAEPSERTDE
jgi:hypothetical protein